MNDTNSCPVRVRDKPVTPNQVVRAVVFGWVGLGTTIIAAAPARLKQVKNDLAAARFIGEMAVTRGIEQLRDRLSGEATLSTKTTNRPGRPPVTTRSSPDATLSRDQAVQMAQDKAKAIDEAFVPRSKLPIPNYDMMPAIDVVALLANLDTDERSLVEDYERTNRGRRTILGKLAQLKSTT